MEKVYCKQFAFWTFGHVSSFKQTLQSHHMSTRSTSPEGDPLGTASLQLGHLTVGRVVVTPISFVLVPFGTKH